MDFFQPVKPFTVMLNGIETLIGKEKYYKGTIDSQKYITLSIAPYLGTKHLFLKMDTLRFDFNVSYSEENTYYIRLSYDVKSKLYKCSIRNKKNAFVTPEASLLKDILEEARSLIAFKAEPLLIKFDTEFWSLKNFRSLVNSENRKKKN